MNIKNHIITLTKEVVDYYAVRTPIYDETAGYKDPIAEKLRIPIKKRFQNYLSGCDVLEIACGTGYWTEVIAKSAKSILATDINHNMLEIARERLKNRQNVKFLKTDAYSLNEVHKEFNAAFAIWWWSHIPKTILRKFLWNLNKKLQNDSIVLFVDQMPGAYKAINRQDAIGGDLIEERKVGQSKKYNVVKNFPNEQEIRKVLMDIGKDIYYKEYSNENSWNLMYKVMK